MKSGNKNIVIILVIMLLIIAAGAWFLFFKNKSSAPETQSGGQSQTEPGSAEEANRPAEKVFDEDNIGEVYCAPIDEEHIVYTDDGAIMMADNELLVVAGDSVTKAGMDSLAKEYGAEIVGFIEQTHDYQLKFGRAMTESELNEIREKLLESGKVTEAGFNYIFPESEDAVCPGIEYYAEEARNVLSGWKNFKPVTEGMWGHNIVNAMSAWNYMENHRSVVNPVRVGLFDVAFFRHTDLRFAEIKYETEQGDDHGTHVAGTMAARGDNTEGICGIYPYSAEGGLYGVSYYGINRYSENHEGRANWLTSSVQTRIAFSELILRNVKVINYSLGFNWYIYDKDNDCMYYQRLTRKKSSKSPLSSETTLPQFFDWVVDQRHFRKEANALGSFLSRAKKCGYEFVIVTAAGNDSNKKTSEDIHLNAACGSFLNMIRYEDFPEVYDRIIVVGSLGTDNSCYDVSKSSNTGERVDIYAPGYNIHSLASNDGFVNMSGTSMAAPHVSGAAANCFSINSNLSGEDVKRIIKESYRFDSQPDYPILDAAQAVVRAHGTEGKGGSDSDSGAILGWVFYNPTNDEGYSTQTHHPVTDCKIYIQNANDRSDKTIVTTDEAGHWEAPLSPGEYIIGAKSEKYGKALIGQQENCHIMVYANEVQYVWINYPRDAYGNESDRCELCLDAYDDQTKKRFEYGEVGCVVFDADYNQLDFTKEELFIDREHKYSFEIQLPYEDEITYIIRLSVRGYEPLVMKAVFDDGHIIEGEKVYFKKESNDHGVNEYDYPHESGRQVVCFDIIDKDTGEILPYGMAAAEFEKDGVLKSYYYKPYEDIMRHYSMELEFDHEPGKEYMGKIYADGYKTTTLKIGLGDDEVMFREGIYLEREDSGTGNEASDWKTAYLEFLDKPHSDNYSSNLQNHLWQYTLYDINNDGIPELIECFMNYDFLAEQITVATFDPNRGRAVYITVNGYFCDVFTKTSIQEMVLFENSTTGTGYQIENGGFVTVTHYTDVNRLSMTDLGFNNRNITHYTDDIIRQVIIDY